MISTFVFLTKFYFHLNFSEHSILCFITFWLHNFDDKSTIVLTYVPLYTHICNVGDVAAPNGAKIGLVCMCVKNHPLLCQKHRRYTYSTQTGMQHICGIKTSWKGVKKSPGRRTIIKNVIEKQCSIFNVFFSLWLFLRFSSLPLIFSTWNTMCFFFFKVFSLSFF